MGPLRSNLAALLLLTTTATAQIDVSEYLPLGAFNGWRAENVDNSNDVTTLKVTKVKLVDGVLRYWIAIPVLDGLEKLSLVFGVDEGVLQMYSMRLTTDSVEELSAETVHFKPPIVLGTTSTVLDGEPFVTAVDTVQKLEFDLGLFSKSIKVSIEGNISSSWVSVGGDLDTPTGIVAAADLVGFVIGFDLDLSSDDALFEVSETFNESMGAILARDMGYVQVAEDGAHQFRLEKAILPGTTLGDFPPLPSASFLGVSAPVSGVFTVHEASDAATTGGDFVLTDVRLEHWLKGKALLHANAALIGSLEPTVPVLLSGSCKLRTDGTARLKLNGNVKLPDVTKKVRFTVKQDITADPTTVEVAYKSGKDYQGSMQLGLAPEAAAVVSVTIATPVDRMFQPKATRRLGAEGVLSIGVAQFPLTIWGTVKSKSGKPDKHSYTMRQTGISGNVLVNRGQATGPFDFTLDKLTLKLFGRTFKDTDLAGVITTVE